MMTPPQNEPRDKYIAPDANGSPANQQPLVSVVIPTLNEAENLPYVLPRIPWWVYEALLVDGRSTDNTVEVARSLSPSIRTMYQKGCGKGDALLTGFAAATGDIIVTLDADGSADPAEMTTFVGALLAGADYAKGSRFLQGGGTADMGPFRFLGNWFLRALVRLLFGGRYSDLCYGYNAFWKDVLPQLHLDTGGFEIETMMNLNALTAGLNVVEVPSFEAKRIHGMSRLRAIPDGWRVLKTILKSRLRNHNRHATHRMKNGNRGYSARHLIDPPFNSSQRSGQILCPACGNRLQAHPKNDH